MIVPRHCQSEMPKLRALILLASFLCTSAANGAPPQNESPKSQVPKTLQQIRRQMLNEEMNSLTFRHMDEIFTTRPVARSGAIQEIPYDKKELDFTYEFEGQTRTPTEFLDRTHTNALIIIKDGKIVYENYLNNSNAATRFMGWSMTKSWTSLLIGIALEEGKISSIDDSIDTYLPELSGGAYTGVSIRHILAMRSGVDYEERYDFKNPGIAASNHENALVKNLVRFADVARNIKRVHKPGTVFAYKTIDTAVLGWLIERVTSRTVADYTSEKLWQPLGAEADGYYIMDGPPGTGREFSGAGFSATARDYARLGLMLLHGGAANDRQIVSRNWIKQATAPFDGQQGQTDPRGPGYGYQFWMGLLPGTYSATGLQGQYVYVDPKTDTVIVKLSYFPLGDMVPHAESEQFFTAVSKWKPKH